MENLPFTIRDRKRRETKLDRRRRRIEEERRAGRCQAELTAERMRPASLHVRRGLKDSESGKDICGVILDTIADAKRLRYRKPRLGWRVS
jgi:hypothetical protein